VDPLTNYRRRVGYTFGDDGTVIAGGSYNFSTESACADACNGDPYCNFYTYNTTTGDCKLRSFEGNKDGSSLLKINKGKFANVPGTIWNYDLRMGGGSTLSDCQAACDGDSFCDAATFGNGVCYYKTSTALAGTNVGFKQS
jgi:hypothetical protein